MRLKKEEDWFSGCEGRDPWGDAHESWRDREDTTHSRKRVQRDNPFDGRQHQKERTAQTQTTGRASYAQVIRDKQTAQRQRDLRSRKKRRSPIIVILVAFFLLSFGVSAVTTLLASGVFEAHFSPEWREDWGDDWGWSDDGDWDVEKAEDANEKYSIAPYEGDSSGLTVALLGHGGKTEMQLPELYEICLPSCVSITVYAEDSAAYGSGVVLTSDGYILTCAHVVENMENAVVTTSDGTDYDALMVGSDRQTDLAVLKIEAEGLRSAEFGDSNGLRIGETVCAIGDSLGVQFRSSLSNGIVSGLNREVSSSRYAMVLIQTTAAVNSGNSGGALFNSYGQVVGIVNMKMSNRAGSAPIDNMGLAIPSVTVKDVVESLAENGSIQRPVLGISCYGIDNTASKVNGVPKGLWVTEIQEASDCGDAGILKGDIITAVNGVEVCSVAEFRKVTAGCEVGDTVTLTVWRDEALADRLEEEDAEEEIVTDDDEDDEDDKNVEYNFEYLDEFEVTLISSDDVTQ